MGAGVAKSPSAEVNCSQYRRFSPGPSNCFNDMSACEACAIRFSLLKRKKVCYECGKNHCSGCLTKSQATNGIRRRCNKCQLLVSGRFTRADLMDYKVKDLRQFLMRRNVAINNCTEKADLVEALLRFNNSSQYRLEQDENNRRMQHLQQQREERLRQEEQQRSNPRMDDENDPATTDGSFQGEPPSYADVLAAAAQAGMRDNNQPDENPSDPVPADSSTTTTSSSSYSTAAPQDTPPAPSRQRVRIEHIATERDIESLTVLQLKEVLATSYVDYRGCVEKWELQERVTRLWRDTAENKRKAEELERAEQAGETGGDSGTAPSDADLCKICMERLIDCVLLECGHMVTCTQCGKQMAECPICRQYVVRVVHVFK